MTEKRFYFNIPHAVLLQKECILLEIPQETQEKLDTSLLLLKNAKDPAIRKETIDRLVTITKKQNDPRNREKLVRYLVKDDQVGEILRKELFSSFISSDPLEQNEKLYLTTTEFADLFPDFKDIKGWKNKEQMLNILQREKEGRFQNVDPGAFSLRETPLSDAMKYPSIRDKVEKIFFPVENLWEKDRGFVVILSIIAFSFTFATLLWLVIG